MNQENSNSDKITIKVRHSDEDYHDITIDWSNESFDYRKQLFHQLSAYTGIPIKQRSDVHVVHVNHQRNASMLNAEHDQTGSANDVWNWEFDTKEHAMESLHDGDCFLFETMMHVYANVPGISCTYYLVHRDVANESGCNPRYCHDLGRRSFTRNISEIIKAYQSQPILDPMVNGQTEEERKRIRLSVYNDHNREIMSIVDAHSAPQDCRIRRIAFGISKEDFEVKIQKYLKNDMDSRPLDSNIFFRSEMNQENSNSDKITIKVRHSDEDYHDITIDWSNESFDYRKQLFHQLSAYTGIPIKQRSDVHVVHVNHQRNASMLNAEHDQTGSANDVWNWEFDTKEHAMESLHDGDCFLFETMMHVYANVPGISCTYYLVHRDVANESGCNPRYCHDLGRRSFTRNISEIIKAYQSQPILDPMVNGQTEEERKRIRLSVYNDHNREIMSIVDAHSAPQDCRIRRIAFGISKEDFEVKIQKYLKNDMDSRPLDSNIFFRSEMNQENSNSDKITIKVRHSDEDYHDITIDWSNESFDYRKQLFHQLSAYTGIPIKQQSDVHVVHVNHQRNASMLNAEHDETGFFNAHYAWQYDTKELAMSVFHDGDCFLLETLMHVDDIVPGINCAYKLVHRDVANESGCNLKYCHDLGRRSFTRKILEIIKADQSKPILDPMVNGQTEEERKRIRLALYDDHLKGIKTIADAHSVPQDCEIKYYYAKSASGYLDFI
ncbi:uncharacterized protein LOC107368007 [Tetranychus urticae]|uniref:Uncharacterized protein n=1 Tax=Tetranychus urticae TaxID=32264 RepID=T1KWX9_TETUR|nr:uncharacterized protein LOC107368007 [Tetranychus urticae]